MVLLILLWLAASVSLAVLGGQWLRAGSASVSDEADVYLRRLTDRRRDRVLGITLRLLAAACLAGAVATGSAAVVERLPDVAVVAHEGSLDIGPFRTTSTTQPPSPPADAPRSDQRYFRRRSHPTTTPPTTAAPPPATSTTSTTAPPPTSTTTTEPDRTGATTSSTSSTSSTSTTSTTTPPGATATAG